MSGHDMALAITTFLSVAFLALWFLERNLRKVYEDAYEQMRDLNDSWPPLYEEMQRKLYQLVELCRSRANGD